MTVKELQHLAAAMAHEVRNPLNSMAIHVELLEGRIRKEGAGPEVL
ncbi:MAG: histidine kinase dimerization/phospho-acceptor domain-containing protein, partial [Steroidobacteraceae bacterium]